VDLRDLLLKMNLNQFILLPVKKSRGWRPIGHAISRAWLLTKVEIIVSMMIVLSIFLWKNRKSSIFQFRFIHSYFVFNYI
jgi:hypothetical protein